MGRIGEAMAALFGASRGEAPGVAPQAAVQSGGGGVVISSPAQLDDYLRGGRAASGQYVTPESAMRTGAVFACVRILSSVPSTLPLDLKRKIDERTRQNAANEPIARVLQRRPNRWQTPAQFRKMLTAHVKLQGFGCALIVRDIVGGRAVRELIPMQPSRVRVEQLADQTLQFIYSHPNGRRVVLAQKDVFYLVGLTLDGVHGVSPLAYARGAIGLAQAQEDAGASVFRNGARASVVLEHPSKLSGESQANLKASLDEYRSGGDAEGKALILEEGMKVSSLAMTAEDAQWIESRKFSRSDIAMFFGVPPHMIGDTEKTTSWGTGIEQQTQGFLTFTAEEDLTMWEQTIDRDLIADPNSTLYARFNRAALVKGDIKARWDAYAVGRRIKVLSANDVRTYEDLDLIEGGDVYENPDIAVNTGGGNEPAPTA